MSNMKIRILISKFSISLVSLILFLLFLEGILRCYYFFKPWFVPPPLHIVTNTPVIYGLNPEHPEINFQGLRDDVVKVPKPQGVFRILVLGDSVAYGIFFDKKTAFPEQLEVLLQKQNKSAEVINTAVAGYTAYNELQYYLTKGRTFEPDIVLLAFCMNDAVNPRLHWKVLKNDQVIIPDEAIPNKDYDRNEILPLMRTFYPSRLSYQDRGSSIWAQSRLYEKVVRKIGRFHKNRKKDIIDKEANVPINITGEDNISIKVLLDESTPEWKWLTSTYRQLQEVVENDGAKLMLVLFPLSYQLSPNYPFFPQNKIVEFCEEHSILCLDLMDAFKQKKTEDIFLVDQGKYYDIWHLTALGHQYSAEVIFNYLHSKHLLQIRNHRLKNEQ